MTAKRDAILNAALELFAAQGFAATSTARVAKAAGVSEGLIFRHFHSKEGLLAALMQEAKTRAEQIFSLSDATASAEDRLRSLLTAIFAIPAKEYPFWRLMYSLKWAADSYDESGSRPMRKAFEQCFIDLSYEAPREEADLAMAILDGIATDILLRKKRNKAALKRSLLKRYGLSTHT